MSKFLTTVGNSYYIEELIKTSFEKLVLVTPFLKLSRNLVERITDADIRGVQITLIYGKSELSKQEQIKLESLKNLQIFFCENLHAKCYHNDKLMIIGSMNLYEFSERNNREMGILIDKEEDSEIFSETLEEIQSIINASEIEKEADTISYAGNSNEETKYIFQESYSEIYNLHLPTLYEYFHNNYPNHEITFQDHTIEIIDFPRDGIDLCISSRIDLSFHGFDKNHYSSIVKYNESKFENDKPGIRFFWNKKALNIYTEKDFQIETDLEGLKSQADKFIDIIEFVNDNLKIVRIVK